MVLLDDPEDDELDDEELDESEEELDEELDDDELVVLDEDEERLSVR
ncbi:hypothetical protein SAMN05660874_01794 [Saccharopolyspora flava]|uniref:Uncharacterized protein n=1 Tax=Saccharopolyspora flava TaxID=95161 RepID=A0A1I6QSA9_9PSEU|nr:hypothetical protein SAMN05660874_01794 [Saccharopolyspora flava]